MTTTKQLTILITGASSGFGEATAKLLSRKGHRLILLARRLNRLKALQEELPNSKIICTDVRDKAKLENEFLKLTPDWIDIDVVINNAGLARGISPMNEGEITDWEEMIDTNIKGVLYVTRLVLPIMIKRNIGHIINIGSIAGIYPYKGGNVYGATKAFIHQLSKNLRTDLLGTNIRVTDIAPGAAETEFSLVRFNGDEKKASAWYKDTRALSANDVAEAILWTIERPIHVNIDYLEIVPTDQAPAGLTLFRHDK